MPSTLEALISVNGIERDGACAACPAAVLERGPLMRIVSVLANLRAAPAAQIAIDQDQFFYLGRL
jgi:hypothetical protein